MQDRIITADNLEELILKFKLGRIARNAAYGLTPEQVAELKIEDILKRVEDEIRDTIDGLREQHQMIALSGEYYDFVAEEFEIGSEETDTNF